MTIAVESCADDEPSVLVVDVGIARPDNWGVPHQTAVTPAHVRRMIASAREAGWVPADAPPFHLRYAGVLKDVP